MTHISSSERAGEAGRTANEQHYYATIRGEMLQGSLRWLSECYREIRDESCEGNTTFRPVNVYRCGTVEAIGHISYNGRIWNRPAHHGLDTPLCLDDSEMLFDSRAALSAKDGR